MTRNYMNKYLVFFLVISLTTLSSCNKKLIRWTGKAKSSLSVHNFDFQYLQARSKIKFDSPDQHLSSSAIIRMKKDSVIWVSVSPALGFEAARALITPDTLLFVNRINKEYYAYNYQSLSKQIHFKVDFEMIQSAIIGNLILPREPEDEVEKKENTFVLTQHFPPYVLRSAINAKSMRPESVMAEEMSKGNSMAIDYKEFQWVKDQAFPFATLISIVNKTDKGPQTTKIDIHHSKVEIEENAIKFPFSIPGKYEQQ